MQRGALSHSRPRRDSVLPTFTVLGMLTVTAIVNGGHEASKLRPDPSQPRTFLPPEYQNSLSFFPSSASVSGLPEEMQSRREVADNASKILSLADRLIKSLGVRGVAVLREDGVLVQELKTELQKQSDFLRRHAGSSVALDASFAQEASLNIKSLLDELLSNSFFVSEYAIVRLLRSIQLSSAKISVSATDVIVSSAEVKIQGKER